MPFNFIKHKENEYLVPVTIEEKESYYYDLMNIEHSFTGRIDAWITNTFIMEAAQLIINAIHLFEMGYFDCACYSLRQSLEVSTTMLYLVDTEDDIKNKALINWKKELRFPMHAQMIDFLKKNGAVFKDFKQKMGTYFKEIASVKKKLNKYIHKQGFDKFYVSKNHPLNGNKSRNIFIKEFEKYLKTCIGEIAVFRLAIDPFPILLNDEEIYHRTTDLMTEPYSEDFIEKYIGKKHIESYKNTAIYQDHYNYYVAEEKKEECVSNVVKHQFINTTEIDTILLQKHLLSTMDLVAVFICDLCHDIVKVYTMNGLTHYFTDRNTVRTKTSWDGRDFIKFKASTPSCNLPYDGAFITYAAIAGEDYFIEHNKPLSNDILNDIREIPHNKGMQPTPSSPVFE